MTEYALLIDGAFVETRRYDERPPHLPHKNVEWYPVVREQGEPFQGIEDDTYVIRALPPVPLQISDRQFFHILALNGAITEAEALEAVKTGELPAQIMALIEALPEEQIFGAKMLMCGATVFQRLHPLTEQLGQAMGYTSRQIDDLFRAAGQL